MGQKLSLRRAQPFTRAPKLQFILYTGVFGTECSNAVQMSVKKWENAEQINARLRDLTVEVRKLRHEMTPPSRRPAIRGERGVAPTPQRRVKGKS